MHIAQIAPLTESIPPKLYGGTERVVSWLTDELVSLGHDVVLFASGDSHTSAKLESCWPKALRLDNSIRDPNALHMTMLERVRRRARDFDCCTSISTIIRSRYFSGSPHHLSPHSMGDLTCRSISRFSRHSLLSL